MRTLSVLLAVLVFAAVYHPPGPQRDQMHLRIGYFIRTIAALNRIGLALKPRLWLLKGLRSLFPVAVTGGSGWLFKWLLKATEYLIVNSRSDADAQAALAIMKHVHGGGKAGMYRDRIADQMCRDPDEELSYYGTAARCNMSIIIYNLPSGCRLWFNMLLGGDIAVGWGFLQPGADYPEFWSRPPEPEATPESRAPATATRQRRSLRRRSQSRPARREIALANPRSSHRPPADSPVRTRADLRAPGDLM